MGGEEEKKHDLHNSTNIVTLSDTTIINILFNFFPNDKFYTLQYWKSLQTTISNLMKMEDSSSKGLKAMNITGSFFPTQYWDWDWDSSYMRNYIVQNKRQYIPSFDTNW